MISVLVLRRKGRSFSDVVCLRKKLKFLNLNGVTRLEPVVEHLPGRLEALDSISGTTTRKRERENTHTHMTGITCVKK
jgi:hypothetical protein